MQKLALFKETPEILRKISVPVVEFGSSLNHVIDDMTYVMRSCEKAIGIAAVQVHEPIRLGILELNHRTKDPGKPFVLVNPEILSHGGLELNDESCLSLPGMKIKKRRATLLKVRFQTVEGKRDEILFRGLWARCVAHEIDHLNGKLIIDT